MIIGFSKYGRGSGDRAVNYLMEGEEQAIPYLTGKSRRGAERNPPPVVLRGDPRLTRRLINSVPFTRKYTSGVLSFEEKSISPETEQQIMDRFEAAAFAGLAKDRYTILWVRHSHTGRHEMHFVSPAIDLGTSKALNINPPRKSTRETFDTLRRLLNDEFHLSDPDDPARARSIRVPSYLAKGAPTRENLRSAVTAYLESKVKTGAIKSRCDLLRLLRDAGYAVSRCGENYVTIVGKDGSRCRLKGALFKREFAVTPQTRTDTPLSSAERASLETKLGRLVAARAAFNERRYRVSATRSQPLASLSPYHQPESIHDRTRTSSSERFGTLDGRIDRARRTLDAAVERTRSAAHRFGARACELGHNSRQLDRATRTFGEAVERFERRQFDHALIRRYGVPRSVTATARFKQHDREREWEPV